MLKNIKNISSVLLSVIFIVSCDEGNIQTDRVDVPSTYEFFRDGESSVSFSGQTNRLDMLSEIKSYLTRGDAGQEVLAVHLNNMYSNENSPFEGADLNTSTKQLESKTLLSDVSFYKDLFAAAEEASAEHLVSQSEATQGQSGRLQRGNSESYILVNEKGWEFTQFVEKGLMGSVFYHQIYNVYLTDERIGPDVDNVSLVEGAKYTKKEHHFDEAFGYWGVPVNFPQELTGDEKRFWANYTYGRSPLMGSVEILKNAFLEGRTAIVNDDQSTLDLSVSTISEELEIVTAATAIHYLNDAQEYLSQGDIGSLFHVLSEAYLFIRAIKMNPNAQLSGDQIDTLLQSGLGAGGDFWTIDAATLAATKQTIGAAYPRFDSYIDQL